ncbi:MAG: hypothetical protein ACTSV3_01755 [Candidatus Thorarchaeota archaeon]
MALGEISRLERFRRTGVSLNVPPPQEGLSPAEEIDHIRARVNALLFPSFKEWMLPGWAVLALRDINTEEVFLESLENDLYRNWSLIGGVGSRKYAVADSRGLTTARPDCGSIDFLIDQGDEILFPALEGKDGAQLHLVSTEDQIYQWEVVSGSVEITRLVYHVERNGAEYLYNEINLKNYNLEGTTCRFYVVVRPLSLLGFEPIESIRYDASTRRVICNRQVSLILDHSPTSVVMTKADDPDLIRKIRSEPDRTDESTKDKKGLAQCVLRYDVKLPPAGSQRFFFVSPFGRTAESAEESDFKPDQRDRDFHVASWFDFSEERLGAMLPDETLKSAFDQAVASLAIQVRSVMFPDEPHLASIGWKDRIRVLLALIHTRCTSLVCKIAEDLVTHAGTSSGPLEPSIFSPIIWGVLQIEEYGLTHIKDIDVKSLADRLVRAIQASSSEDASSDQEEDLLTHYGLVQPGTFRDIEDCAWNLAAMQAIARLYLRRNESEKAASLQDSIEDYTQRLKGMLADVQKSRWPRPTDPQMEKIDREILDLLSTASCFESGLDPAILADLCDQIESRSLLKGLWRQSHPRELYSSYLSLRLAQFHARMCEREEVETLLKRAMDFLSDDYLLPDCVNTKTYGGSYGTGSSVLAAADLVLLLRTMMLVEVGERLILLPGIPDNWYTAKKPLIVDGIPTRFGPMGLEIGASANQHQIEVRSPDLPKEMDIHVPPSVPMRMVKAFGASIVERAMKASSPHVRIVPLAESAVLTFHK